MAPLWHRGECPALPDQDRVQDALRPFNFPPGEYMLRGQINDASGNGGGGDLCCWTNVFVKVTIK